MNYRATNLKIGLLLLCACSIATGNAAAVQADEKLPAGSYVYLGPGPGTENPRAFSVSSEGRIQWQESDAAGKHDLLKAPIQTRQSKKSKQYQWESYKFPIIKWKQHPITTVSDGIAQLTTTFDPSGGPLRNGVIKFNLTLSKFDALPNTVTVQMLDTNGFKLNEFTVYKDTFHPVPGTALVEASDENQCSRETYRKIRDYLVK